MTDMTAEQAIEILNRVNHRGRAWRLLAHGAYGEPLTAFELLAIAREYRRQEAAEMLATPTKGEQ